MLKIIFGKRAEGTNIVLGGQLGTLSNFASLLCVLRHGLRNLTRGEIFHCCLRNLID
jgi:hypothetical protein